VLVDFEASTEKQTQDATCARNHYTNERSFAEARNLLITLPSIVVGILTVIGRCLKG
jgi:hypothetical protein